MLSRFAVLKRPVVWGTLLVAGLCLAPHLLRLTHPSLYADDLVRVADLRTQSLAALLTRPFNEHIAPVFETVSWLSWQAAGRRLTRSPWSFTVASFVPGVLCAVVLARLVWLETGSNAAALVALVLFTLPGRFLEVFWWYSASSFAWALLFTLLAWLAVRSQSRLGPFAAALAALAAPSCSAIGLLAGPTAASRFLADSARSGPIKWKSRLAGLIPLAGTGLYLALAAGLRYGAIVTESVARQGDLAQGLLTASRAPLAALLPGLLGYNVLDGTSVWGPAFSFALVFGALVWAGRDPDARPVVLAGLVLAVGGYAITHGLRTTLLGGPVATLRVQRYHLFPLVGLILIASRAAAPILRRIPAERSVLPAIALAVLLLAVNFPAMKGTARFFRFKDQHAFLEAVEHLDAIKEREGTTRAQALEALGRPPQPRWAPIPELNPLVLLGPTHNGSPDHPRSNANVREALLNALTPRERHALFGAEPTRLRPSR